MLYNKNRASGKVYIPWYDADPICFTVIFFMALIFLFGVSGIVFALEKVEYNEHVWVPCVLVIMSGFVTISIITRLVKRHIRKVKEHL
ncbi:MAG: hypothetical protein JRI28_02445 [Deltaproteobacteria bacterium]|nr:hypothetical protein [Deltaproteobacteria bacterium]